MAIIEIVRNTKYYYLKGSIHLGLLIIGFGKRRHGGWFLSIG